MNSEELAYIRTNEFWPYRERLYEAIQAAIPGAAAMIKVADSNGYRIKVSKPVAGGTNALESIIFVPRRVLSESAFTLFMHAEVNRVVQEFLEKEPASANSSFVVKILTNSICFLEYLIKRLR
jgi:hypothetical protein